MALNPLQVQVTINGIGAPISTTTTVAGGSGDQDIDETIIIGATDQLLNVAFALARLKLFSMISDQALTIHTNEIGSYAQEVIALPANSLVLYVPGAIGAASPFLGDITGFYVTNASGVAANLRIKLREDITP